MAPPMGRPCLGFLLWALIASAHFTVDAARIGFWEDALITMPSEDSASQTSPDDSDESAIGTRWAVLIAGSGGYWNYRHQADVCHAYQILKRGGVKDENIVVFMYDDIAYNIENPRQGEIINSPEGEDVYAGVPKDYTGKDVNPNNFFSVILGNKTALTGQGSGKVVDSGPDDRIFIFYSDHGGPGVLGMPTGNYLYADDFNEVLKKKHAAGTYKEMVIYIEACESGSIFEGLLADDLNIYVTTASSAYESSWGTYCPGMSPSPPPEFQTCLGDLYSVAWMEDSEVHNLKRESLQEQYDIVKTRTSNQETYIQGSHVMQYGDVNNITIEKMYTYLGSDPANENLTTSDENGLGHSTVAYPSGLKHFLEGKQATGVNQRDADMIYFWRKYTMANEGSVEKLEAQQDMVDMLGRRLQLDKSVELIGKLLFGYEQGPAVLKATREPGQALVDDWECLKTMVSTFECHCGSLSDYGMKHMRALANICNAGVDGSGMAIASAEACAIFNQKLSN